MGEKRKLEASQDLEYSVFKMREVYSSCKEGGFKYENGHFVFSVGEWRNWNTRTAQNRIPQGLRVQIPPRPQNLKSVVTDEDIL